LALLGSAVSRLPASAQSVSSTGAVAPVSSHRQVLDRYCVTCHNERLKTAGLPLDQIDAAHPGQHAEEWEKVVRKLRTGAMPPANAPQPSAQDRTMLVSWLESSLDTAAAAHPNPGRTDTLRRLNRTEYQNAIRDLLSVDIDAASLLPPDDSGHGFDNVTVGDLSPALLDRYISTAQKISRLAIGGAQTSAQTDVIRLPPDLTQEEYVPGLPVGTRGGMSSPHTFTHDGEYDIQIWLARDRTGSVGGLRASASHELLVLVDRTLVKTMTIEMPADGDDTTVDLQLARNTGGAFSLFQAFTPVLAIVAGVVAFFLVRTVRRTHDTLLVVALSLVLGGALGNLLDRVFRTPGFLRGAVVDFVHVGAWPTFNVADSAITIGAILVVVWSLRTTARERQAGGHRTGEQRAGD
jgi:lipoprotein signal peptidase